MNPTEERIVEAAREIFTRQGLTGARMQEIADRAGVNKAMLHYYFATKEALFDRVFAEAIGRIAPAVREFFAAPDPLETKIDKLIDGYFDALTKEPGIAAFILGELRRDPTKLVANARRNVPDAALIQGMLDAAAIAGAIRRVHWRDLLTTIAALSVFPFAARPLLQTMTAQGDAEYDDFLEHRRREARAVVKGWLRP